ncbi:NTF2-like N-terminal transpeptidase domain-containing protein [Thermoanaerobacterium sp. CMT5567-10]|uniref:tetratricopeptide repeat protein n=1 Tax=Thermoanaerobacterium sp. CMT5567-10 TaxID=3061989 RepID=UPI0026E096FD|nr:tetratricopeptide repeat protein [Thermoanaerobacterium sp. CMT5567-10]WKV08203.1 NTF2-like N-terminal transpeptidase domain-containing protein [Thermoanaerobacterium sp. CMT5567-10]
MKKTISLFLLWCTLILVFLLIAGCGAPSGDPKEVLSQYYEDIQNNNIEDAYHLLTEQNKKNINKEDFKLFQQLNNEIMKLKSFKIEKVADFKNKKMGDLQYKYVIEFNVTEIDTLYYDNKDETNNYREYIVDDNGTWKIYKDIDIKKAIASDYVRIGSMYVDGKGEDRDFNQALIDFKNALKYDKNNTDVYYGMGLSYYYLERYNEAIEQLNLALSKINDKKSRSDIYNVLGLSYEGIEKYSDALDAFNKAIESNSENEYAKSNLTALKNFLGSD